MYEVSHTLYFVRLLDTAFPCFADRMGPLRSSQPIASAATLKSLVTSAVLSLYHNDPNPRRKMGPYSSSTMDWIQATAILILAAAGASAQGQQGIDGTIITLSSTQYFTVTTGIPGDSQTRPITGGSMYSIPTGSLASPASVPNPSPRGSALPSPDIFVIEIGPAEPPSESGAPGAGVKARRQTGSGEFLMNAGIDNAVDCSRAHRFELVDGELTSAGQKVSTSPGLASAQRLAVSPQVGSITRTWEIVDGELLWLNASFVGGRAGFCVDHDTLSVFFTTSGPGSEPAGCITKQLTPMFGKCSRPVLVVP